MFLLFLFYNYYIIVREYVLSKYNLSYINQQRWGRDVFQFNKWLYGWQQHVHINNTISKHNKILMIGNHMNLTDMFQLQQMINTQFPEHKMVCLIKEQITNIPLFGKFIRNNHIVIGNNHEKNILSIEKCMNRLNPDKIILFIFPEGGVYHKDNIRKSDKWCKSLGILPYQSCMSPKTRGLYTILNAFSFDSVLQCYLTYPDDIKREKGVNYSDYLINNLPRISEIYIKDISHFFNNIYLLSYDEFSEHIYNYWREVDKTITDIYINYENLRNDYIKHKYKFHDIADYNYITWNSSKYIIVFIPIAYLTHGILYSVSLITLLFTSYQYHIHNQMKNADMFMSVFIISMSYIYNTHLHSNIVLAIGVGFYIIEKCIERYLKTSNTPILYYIHSMLHTFCYLHLLVEFLHRNI